MKIGDMVVQTPYYGNQFQAKKKSGVITYIHPRCRFYAVLFHGEDGDYKESFIIQRKTRQPRPVSIGGVVGG